MKHIVFTVTNDLNYDQRMIKICNSLYNSGYKVTLIGRKNKTSGPLETKAYHQKRLNCFFSKGMGFYAEYNIRLFFYLLFQKADVFCCIDLDTMLPVFFAGKCKGQRLVYDAHEYFSQLKEVVNRPGVYKIWQGIEKIFLPKFIYGYTVSYSIAETFANLYGVHYEVIMNAPMLEELAHYDQVENNIILYQGAVNHARGLEFLIPALKKINAVLHIYGDGNFLSEVKLLITENQLNDKVLLMGKVLPAALKDITTKAYLGINLVENDGLNQYYSLANKFFDYIHALLPQVTMNFPEYKRINDQIEVAVLIEDTKIDSIVDAINLLLENKALYSKLQNNCKQARKTYNWQNEEKKLIQFYKKLIG